MSVLCSVCNELNSKYKCSTCFCPYCSLGCWKTHKGQNICKLDIKEEPNHEFQSILENKKYFTEDTVNCNKLTLLELNTIRSLSCILVSGYRIGDCPWKTGTYGESEVLKKMLKNKYLQNTLINVDKSFQPEQAVLEAMKYPEFVEFVDECLKIVEDHTEEY